MKKNQTARFVFQRIAIRQIKRFFSTNYLLILLWTTFHHLIRHAYFLDFNDENCSIYKNRGWEIVTAGDRSNPIFLNNLYFYISKNEFVVYTELGTSLFIQCI